MNFYVPAKYFNSFFEDICVKTSDKDIKECVSLFQDRKKNVNDLEKLLYKVNKNLMKYSSLEELTKQHQTKSKEWYEWSDNLILFYICKYVLDGSPIPRYSNYSNQ
jgi:hypothetical protein